MKKQKLELTWIGKDVRPRFESQMMMSNLNGGNCYEQRARDLCECGEDVADKRAIAPCGDDFE
jgi:hypothetical protein